MRRTVRTGLGLMLALAACGDDGELRGDGDKLAVANDPSAAPSWADPDAGADLSVADLECPHGGKVGKIEVAFDCFEITTVSCKDLSNVVIELADGTRQRFEGLNGQRGVFRGQTEIVRVWVKAGANHSGDGPGYGERFDAPAQDCPPAPPPPAPPSDAGTDAGCFIVDGVCASSPPPAKDAGCFVADGVCDYTPTPPKPKDAGVGTVGPVGY